MTAPPDRPAPPDHPAPRSWPEFDEEIRAAIRYERGLAVKALIALALVGVVVLLRLYWLG